MYTWDIVPVLALETMAVPLYHMGDSHQICTVVPSATVLHPLNQELDKKMIWMSQNMVYMLDYYAPIFNTSRDNLR